MSSDVIITALTSLSIVLTGMLIVFAWVIRLLDGDKRKWVAKYIELANAVDAARQEQVAEIVKAANARNKGAHDDFPPTTFN